MIAESEQARIKRLVEDHIGIPEALASRMLVNRVQNRVWDREQMVSDGQWGLLKAARTFDESLGFKFSTWAWRAVEWSIDNGIRVRQGGIGRYKRAAVHVEYIDQGVDPYNHAREIENTELVTLVLAKVSKVQRKVLMMRYLQGMTQADVARALGVSQSLVSYRIKMALRKLRKNFATLQTI